MLFWKVLDATHTIFNVEWQIIDQALAAYSRVTVSLYDTLGPSVVGALHTRISILSDKLQNMCKLDCIRNTPVGFFLTL